MDIDAMLFGGDAERLSEEDWRVIAASLVSTLGELLGRRLEFDEFTPPPARPPDFEAAVGHGFYSSVRTVAGTHLLQPHWVGLVGCSVADGRGFASANLFPNICQRRVSPTDDNEFVFLRYVLGEDDRGSWKLDGWEIDEHQEYGGFVERACCR